MSRQVSREDREKIMQVISDPVLRKGFKANSKKALEDVGVSGGPGVDELVSTLYDMSADELDAIAKLNTKMVQMGLTEEGSKLLGRAV